MTMTATAERTPPRMTATPPDLTEIRERRFQARREIIEADEFMDPRLKALFLDRTLWETKRIADELGLNSPQRVSAMRMTVRKYRGKQTIVLRDPHPLLFPSADAYPRKVYGTWQPAVEAGRVIEWAIEDGRWIFNSATGQLEAGRIRHGRRRSLATVRGRRHIPGTPNAYRERKKRERAAAEENTDES